MNRRTWSWILSFCSVAFAVLAVLCVALQFWQQNGGNVGQGLNLRLMGVVFCLLAMVGVLIQGILRRNR